MQKRVFINPKVKDKVTVLKTVAESGGTHTLVQVELAVGGGTPPHYHTSFDEEFTAVQGTLGVMVNKKKILLQPGEKAVAPKNTLHRFFNPGREPIVFNVGIISPEERFIKSLCIGYGLAEDGLTNNKGIPSKLDHLAVLTEMSDTRFPGILGLLGKYLEGRARRARKRGVEKQLIEKYWN
jgi:quercetin dioxygenase-like cupin family protein